MAHVRHPAAAGVRLGVAFPHGDPGFATGTDAILAFTGAVEDLGYDYLTIADHVLGADARDRPGWPGRYDVADPFREVFVQLGHLAAITRLELVPSVVVLPQRQTGLVAKQAAELAELSRGGLRLGVAAGWNQVEFDALGMDFRTRGARLEEQIAVLRMLWTRPVVSFQGRFHALDRVGIAPRPPVPIPIWLGGGDGGSAGARERVARRVATLGDGWISPPGMPSARFAPVAAHVRELAGSGGRDVAEIGIQVTLLVPPDHESAALTDQLDHIKAAAPTHITIDTRGHGRSAARHVDDLAAVLDLVRSRL